MPLKGRVCLSGPSDFPSLLTTNNASCPIGQDKQGQRKLAEIIEQHEALKKPTSLDWILHQELTPRCKCLLFLAPQAAAIVAQEQPNIDLMEVCSLHNWLGSKKKHGLVLTTRLTDEDCVRLRAIIEDLPKGYLAHDNSFDLIFDAGCTKPATGFKQILLLGPSRTCQNLLMCLALLVVLMSDKKEELGAKSSMTKVMSKSSTLPPTSSLTHLVDCSAHKPA